MAIGIINNFNVVSDLSLFLPKQQTLSHKLLISQLNNGHSARTLFITLDGGQLKDRVLMSKKLAQHLSQSQYFEQVLNGEQLLRRQDKDLFLQYRYLLSQQVNDEFLTESHLKQTINSRYQELLLPFPPVDKKLLPQDPTGENKHVLSMFGAKKTIKKEHGVWVDKDNTQTILITRTYQGAVDIERQQEVIDYITAGFDQFNESGNLKIELTGLSVASSNSKRIIQAEAKLFSIAATIALIALLWFSFRSLKLVLISTLPMLTAVITGMFFVLIWFNSIHGITLVFAITILGMAIDYPIHFFSHLDKQVSNEKNMKNIWGTMLVGLVTTVIAFLSLIFSNFDGLYQLGLFTSCGLLAAALTTRYVLPFIIGEVKYFKLPKLSLVSLSKSHVILLLLCSSIFVSYVFSQQLPQWEKSLSSLSPLPKSYNQRDHHLRTSLGVAELRYVILVEAKSIESVLQKSENLRPKLNTLVNDGALKQYDMAAQYLPSAKLQNLRKSLLPSVQQLKERLVSSIADTPFKKTLFNPFVEDVRQSKILDPLTVENLNGSIIELLSQSMLIEIENQHYGVVYLTGVKDLDSIRNDLKLFTEKGDLKGIKIYDLSLVSKRLLLDFYEDFLFFIMVAVCLIALILLLTLKVSLRAFSVMLILIFTLTVEIAWLVLLGEALTLFHLVSLILVFGLGLDYALFFTRQESISEKNKTLYGLVVCLMSSILVFGILSLSSIPVLNIIGKTTAIGVFLAFIFSLLASSFMENSNKNQI